MINFTNTQADFTDIQFESPESRSPILLFLSDCLAQEVGLSIVLRPLFFGLGCIIYFSLSFEPSLYLTFSISLFLFLLFLVFIFPSSLRHFFLFSFFVFFGIFVSGYHTNRISTPVITTELSTQVIGTVYSIEHRPNDRIRYTLDIESGGIFLPEYSDFRGRIRLSDSEQYLNIRVGDTIIGDANIFPFQGHIYPDGYSPSFHQWFSGVSATGYYIFPPSKISSGSSLSFWHFISGVRYSISRSVSEALPDRTGSLASALIVGDRSGIDYDTNQSLRISGLAHILAISGLHMGLAALTIMYFIRRLFLLFPVISQRINIRKLAAFCALITTGIYFLLSGGPVSAQRAYIMVFIMLVAILFNRRAISIRNVSFSFFIILLLSPHSILSAGFQMSFAAVAGLVSCYEFLYRYYEKREMHKRFSSMGFLRKFFFRDLSLIVLTTFIASLSTGMFSAYHFNLVSPYGVVANALAMPIVSFFLMPSVVLSILAYPFGFHDFFLSFSSYFISFVVWIAEFVESFSSVDSVGVIPPSIVLFFTFGFLILCLLRSYLRLLGFLIILFSLFLLTFVRSPDILISESGKHVGVLRDDKLSILHSPTDWFITNSWRRVFGSSFDSTQKDFECDSISCIYRFDDFVFSIPREHSRPSDYCLSSDLVFLRFSDTDLCSSIPHSTAYVITFSDLRTYGSHSIILSPFRVHRSYDGSVRPWISHRFH